LTNADVGTIFHGALKDFMEKTAQHETWPDIDRTECDGLMNDVLSTVEKAWAEGPLGENAQTRALGKKYLRIIRRAAWMFTQHMKSSSFRPKMAEVGFGTPDSPLPPIRLIMADGTEVLLRGVIDRVDMYEGEESVYLRVVDYKSGRKELDPTQIYWGLQLQLLMYLMAALSAKPGTEPAGAFYFHIDDPLVELDEGLKERAEREIAQLLRLRGIVLSDVAVVNAMDRDFTSMKQVFNKDGSLTAHASAASLEEMRNLLDYAKRTAEKLASSMRKGDIAISPAKTNTFSACKFCEYAGVCRWDARLPGAKQRFLNPLSLEELKARAAQQA
jgi:ATP-dependent helicase/nuclease subunit B